MVEDPVELQKSEFIVWCLVAMATFALAIAGIAGLGRPEIALWATFIAGVCYALAFQKAKFNTLSAPRKTQITAAVISVFAVASIALQIRLITIRRQSPPAQSRDVATGAASTLGDDSPAVTGQGNSITYGAAEPASKKGAKQ